MKNESEELKITLTLAGEVYYFIVASLVSVFLICSIISSNMQIVEAILLIATIWIMPFIFVAAINIIKLITLKNLARYGQAEKR